MNIFDFKKISRHCNSLKKRMGALCCSCLCPESSDRGVEMSNSNRIRILADAKLKGDNVKIKNGTSVEGSGSTYRFSHSNTLEQELT